jgi:hypothetical protein
VPDLPEPSDDPRPRRRPRWGWLLLAVVAAVASFLAVAVQVRRCVVDPAGGEAVCTTGPALGTEGWLVGLVGVGVVLYAVRRGLGR